MLYQATSPDFRIHDGRKNNGGSQVETLRTSHHSASKDCGDTSRHARRRRMVATDDPSSASGCS
jgi:hypothetical protein